MQNPSDYITPVSGLQYWICMVDYGRGRARTTPTGFGADVDPEYTRRQIVEEVRECITRGLNIVHVRFVDGNDTTDHTHEIIAEALEGRSDAGFLAGQDLIDARNDHARDQRKHEVA